MCAGPKRVEGGDPAEPCHREPRRTRERAPAPARDDEQVAIGTTGGAGERTTHRDSRAIAEAIMKRLVPDLHRALVDVGDIEE